MEGSAIQDGLVATCAKGGRREARREERREAILDVAGQHFFEHGYAGTTMSKIAGTLGGSKGTLWSYYPSKEVLFDAVLDRRTRQFRKDLQLELGHEGPVRETLTRFCSSLIQRLANPEAIALYRLVVSEAGRSPEVGRIFHERATLPTQQLMAQYLDRAMERGTLRRDDPFLAAQYLLALCRAGSLERWLSAICAVPEAAEQHKEAVGAVDLFMRAYAP